MMVVMLIISIALAASMPILTKRATSSTGALWRRVTTDTARIYYGTTDGQHVQIGSKSTPESGIASGSKLFINSSNPLSSPQLAFGVNGAYGGVIYVESPSKMNVRLANSSGNTFLLENADLQVEGNSVVNGSNTVSGNGTFGGTLTVGSTSQFNNNLNIGSLGTNYSLLLNGKPVGGGVPIGTVIIWASWTAPSDGVWLECNGQAIPAQYTQLRNLVGAYTPNYSGVFLRGYGSRTSTHYGSVSHSSGGLGALQGDAIRNIWGSFGDFKAINGYSFSGAFSLRSKTGGSHDSDPGGPSSVNFDASLVVPTANENRPVNVAVKYFIKAAD